MSRFDYEKMVQKSLLKVVHNVLKEVLEKGFMGNHHLYIAFQTNRNDIAMSKNLRKKYPTEITIVLQHQFWDLQVDEDKFSVTLSFNDQREKIVVSYNAITSFLDPSVQFALQFIPEENFTDQSSNQPDDKEKTTYENNVISMEKFRNRTD